LLAFLKELEANPNAKSSLRSFVRKNLVDDAVTPEQNKMNVLGIIREVESDKSFSDSYKPLVEHVRGLDAEKFQKNPPKTESTPKKESKEKKEEKKEEDKKSDSPVSMERRKQFARGPSQRQTVFLSKGLDLSAEQGALLLSISSVLLARILCLFHLVEKFEAEEEAKKKDRDRLLDGSLRRAAPPSPRAARTRRRPLPRRRTLSLW